MSGEEDRRVAICLAGIETVNTMLQESPANWENYVNFARSITASVDLTDFMMNPGRVEERILMVDCLQKLAYQDPDRGGVQSLADWCQRQWLRLLESRPEHVEVLRGLAVPVERSNDFVDRADDSAGLGHNWLLKAQKFLASIHLEDGSSSSTASNGRNGGNGENGGNGGNGRNGRNGRMPVMPPPRYTQRHDDVDASQAAADAVVRLSTTSYVEARTALVPATDFLNRAIVAAGRQGNVTGDLLVLVSLGTPHTSPSSRSDLFFLIQAAESYMSLGNVSFPREAEELFGRAIRFLRRARQLPNYALADYLQRYLDEYGRLIS
ncbi:MAG: hypothetical protein M1826_006874 [Phylliscum demangeonii]|nr:MAG: hypothetical protein M1826_006874 [Phylliscum demangeonii]